MNPEYIDISEACIKDANSIREIALDSVVSSQSNVQTGLVDYSVPSLDKYIYRLKVGRFFVAKDSDKVIGFLDSFPSGNLESIFMHDPVVDSILKIEREPFIYINTLALLNEYRGKGIGSQLLGMLEKGTNSPYTSLLAAIVHKPLSNQSSIRMVGKNRFSLQKEIKAWGKFTFGIYKKNLNLKNSNL